MTARRTVGVLIVAFLAYTGLIGYRGVLLLSDHRLAVKGLGVGVLLLPVVGVAVVVRELRFGRDTERLGRRLGAEGGLPRDELPRRASGRVDRPAADAVFARRRSEVEAAPQDWRVWYRLGLAYGDAGDTARGRQAMRRAAVLERGDAGVASPPEPSR